MLEAIDQFHDAIRAAGLVPPDEIRADGALHRFGTNGKRGDDAGWYVLHSDGIPAGSFGDWRTGLSVYWRADIGRALTPAEEAAHRAKVNAIRCQREADEARRQAEAREHAASLWKAATPRGRRSPLPCPKARQGASVARAGWAAGDSDAVRWQASFPAIHRAERRQALSTRRAGERMLFQHRPRERCYSALHEKDGKRWVNFPARQYTGNDGVTRWQPLITIEDKRHSWRFQELALRATDEHREGSHEPRE